MPDLGKAYVQIVPSAQGIQGSITSVLGGEVNAAGAIAEKALGSKLSLGALGAAGAVAAAGKAIYDFTSDAVQVGMGFDSAMSQVAATMGTTVDQIGELRVYAQEMGASTAFSATEAAEALNYMALAGYDAQTSMDMLPNVLNLAAAGGIQLARASDMVTDAQSALGLSLDDTNVLVDQMARASSKSNTSVEQLGDAILTIGATARNVKGGTAELTTVLGVLADNGIKGAEGGTHLRNILLSLQIPTKDGTEALKKLGMTYEDMYDAAGNMRSISEIMLELQGNMEGMSQASRDAIVSGIFNRTDLAAVNALIGTSAERFDELTESIELSQGAAQAMADTQLDNLTGDVTLFRSAMEGLQIVVADKLNPALRFFVELGTGAVSGLTELIAGFDHGVPSVDDLTQSTQNFYDTVASGKTSLDDATVSIEATALMADRYITTLEGMGDTAGMTAAEHQQYHNYLVLLTQAIPELAGMIDLETDSIDGGTDALRENVAAWEARQKVQAGEEYLSEVYQAQSDVLLEQARNSVELTRVREDLERMTTRNADIEARMAELYDEAAEAAAEYSKETGVLSGAESHLSDEYRDLQKEQAELQQQIYEAEDAEAALTKATGENADAVAAAEAEIALAQDTVTEFNRMLSGTEDAAGTAADGIDAVTEAVGETDKVLNEASQSLLGIGAAAEEAIGSGGDLRAVYDELSTQLVSLEGDLDAETLAMVEQQLAALDLAATNQELTETYPMLVGMLEGSVHGSLSELSGWLVENGVTAEEWGQQVNSATGNVINGFSELDTSLDMSLDEMAAQMQANIEAYASWEENIGALMEAAAASGDASQIAFVQYMQEMGIGAAEQVAAMAADVEGSLETFGPLFGEAVAAGMTEAQQSIDGADLGSAVGEAVQAAVEDVEIDASGLGEDITGEISDSVTASSDDIIPENLLTDSAEIAGQEGGSALAESFEGTVPENAAAALAVAAAVGSPIQGITGQTYGFGYEIGSNLSYGMWASIPLVESAASALAGTVSAYTHFSEPDVGPLSDFHTYAPDMMDLFAQGIRDNIGQVEDAVMGMTRSVAGDFDSGLTMTPNVTGGSVASGSDTSVARLIALAEQYFPLFAKAKIVLETGEMVGAMAYDIDQELGNRIGYADRGMAT